MPIARPKNGQSMSYEWSNSLGITGQKAYYLWT